MPSRDNTPGVNWRRASGGRYENWYCILHSPKEEAAFWFRYTLTSFRPGARPPEGRVWAILFDRRRPESEFVLTARRDLAEVGITKTPFALDFGDIGRFENGRASGRLDVGGPLVEWEFTFEPSAVSFRSVASRIVAALVSTSRNVSPNNDTRFRGHLVVDGRRLDFDGAPGHQGHTWGKKMQTSWLWGKCSAFDNEPDAIFEGVSIRRPKGDVPGPPIASLFLKYRGARYVMNTVRHIKRVTKSEYDPRSWRFSSAEGDLKLEGELRPDPDRTHFVRYLDVDCTEAFVRNSCLGEATIRIHRRRGDAWEPETELRAKDTVAFEYVDRQADEKEYRPTFDEGR